MKEYNNHVDDGLKSKKIKVCISMKYLKYKIKVQSRVWMLKQLCKTLSKALQIQKKWLLTYNIFSFNNYMISEKKSIHIIIVKRK